ncbi:MAG: lipoate--protein ligase family protein [Nitrospinae bacterium]|nr:lipoate--protein ligase family protein [Nitrospinota bacterium]
MSDEVPRRWRLLNTGPADGFTNMAVDEAILQACAAGKGSPTLRFYTWSPPALSLGYGQPIAKSVDLARCRTLGIDVVRRPTGGRAVLHEHEVTYSLVIREDDPQVVSGVLASYLTVSQALMQGLSYLGITAELVPLRRSPSHPPDAESPVCFSAPSSYEVAVGGRKIIGSAQRRVQRVILQHGSIPISLDLQKMFAVLLPAPHASDPTTATPAYRPRMTSVEEAGGRSYPYAAVIEALSRGFAEVWGIELVPGPLTAEELQSCAHLRASKYCSPEWTWRR